MKLIDKFLTASRIDDFLNNEEVIAATNVTIADKYAIGFAEWICEKAEVPYIKGKMDSTLEIYKKEKGL